MKIIHFFESDRQAHWLAQMTECGWDAGEFLCQMLEDGTYAGFIGEGSEVLLLTDGDKLVSFCTYAKKDDIPDTDLTPWVGFVYTFPEYRGHHYVGLLFAEADRLARKAHVNEIYVSTNHVGLYEKYGASFLTTLKDEKGADTRIYRMDTYGYYGWQQADVKARIRDYPGIETPDDLYNALWHVWSRETCTARMRAEWSEENRTLGQCTITAFLAQDIFGGQVYGVPLGDGNYHCFNAAGGRVFDLTSEQFGDRQLEYSLRWEQLRHDHFRKPGKRERYELLRDALAEYTRR